MKKSLFQSMRRPALLAVPAAALMLGAAHAQTTIGLNFQAWYYDSGTNPQTIGYAAGYQTTGFPVTGKAFGVAAANWFNTDPLPAQEGISPSATLFGSTSDLSGGSNTFAGTLTLTVNAPNTWQSGIGEQVAGWNPETVAPGNDEVTWGYLDDGNANGQSPSATISGLAAKFPNGYAIQTIAANAGTQVFNAVDITDGTTTSTVDYSAYTYSVLNPQSDGYVTGGTVGISSPSATFTNDTININCQPKTAGHRSPLCGFIITDVPVLTRNVAGSYLLATGGALMLPPPCVVGIGLTYQWQHAGTNLPGATFAGYTNNFVAITDSGSYQAVVTSSFYPSISVTGLVANVSVVPTHAARTATWDANTTTAGAQDGSGTWSNTLTNWWSGSFDDYWGSADSAAFGAGGTGVYTVTLGDNITANAITFNSGVYLLTNSSGQSLTLNGNATITLNTNATIGVPLSTGTNTLLKAGSGKLTLSGAMASTNTFVSAGTVEVLAKNGDSPYIVTNGATLKIGYSTGGAYANDGLQLYGDGTAALTGLYLLGGKTYNVSGGVVVNGAPTTIRQYGTGLAAFGIFDINSNPGLSTTAAASGSIVDANIQMVNYGYGMVISSVAGANTTTGDLVLNGPLNIDAHNGVYGLVKKGSGSLRLNATATATNCGLNITAGSVICGVANCIGTNGALKVAAGTTLDFNGFSQTVSNAPILAGTLKMRINKGGTPNRTVLQVTDGNALNLGGSLVVTSVGSALVIGDSFALFDSSGAGFGGGFTNVILPALVSGQGWSNNLAVDGTIYVVPGSTPPSITTDLSGVTNYAYAGTSPSFSIVATGDPVLHYLWKKNGITPVGVDSPTLILSSVAVSASGYYSVTVTNLYPPAAQSQSNYLVVVTPSVAAAQMVQDAPLASWPFNETNPSTAYDYSGHNNNGTQNGGLTLGATGPQPPGYAGFGAAALAYAFDGGSGYVDCGTGPSLSGTTDFAVEAWLNTTATASGTIIQQRSASGFNGEYEFNVNADGTLYFMVYGGGFQFNFNSPTNRTVNDGNWHHVAAVRSGSVGTIYIDGSAVASATNATTAPLDATIATYIGADLRNFNNYFSGSLCDVSVYSHALSATRVASHAAAGVVSTGPLLKIVPSGGTTVLTWPIGSLQSSPSLTPITWTTMTNVSPYAWLPSTNKTLFYRVGF